MSCEWDWDDGKVYNSIFWENSPGHIAIDHPKVRSLPALYYCDVQGGWDGDGDHNIDADPLFVQPGADDLRLGIGSPCVDKGSNAWVPDWLDHDVDGNPRIINGIVDMGAYEGEYEQQPPADVDYDIDQGEFSILIPEGGDFDPLSRAALTISNELSGDDRTARVTQLDDAHAFAGGYTESGDVLIGETTLTDGLFVTKVFIAFDSADLDGVDPLTLSVTSFDEGTGNWQLAVAGNAADSPGYDSPIGDRIVAVAPDGFGLTNDLGDYGVYWDPDQEKGFVWAIVDYTGDHAVGAPTCTADCAQPPDGIVNLNDLYFVIGNWERGDGPFDVDQDGDVDVFDLFAVLNAWGGCP
jgi:hypothetical protein